MENFLAKKLKRYRQQHGLTQKQLASILYVSDKTVSKWERGNGQPDIETLKKIAQLLETTVDDLLNEREPVYYFEYKSAMMIGMLPALHIVIPNFPELFRTYGIMYSYFPILKRMPRAKAFFSCGFISTGIFSLGVFSRGLFSFGLLSLGVTSVGIASAGILSCGSLSLGLVAFGNIALGILAIANLGIGYLSFGNLVVGRIALGNEAAGTYALSLGNNIHEKELIAGLQQIQQMDTPAMANHLLIQPLIATLQQPWILALFIGVMVFIGLIMASSLIVGLMKISQRERNEKSFIY